MRLVIVGAGYVGHVSGACFADFSHHVCCVDSDPRRLESLHRGEIPTHEPGLSDLVAKNVREGRLTFTGEFADAVEAADVVLIAVGPPPRRGDGHADLSYVYRVAREIAGLLRGYTVVVTKSTGTGDAVERIIHEANPKADISVISNSEFLREGAAIDDFTQPDRIVIGTDDACARTVTEQRYRPLYLNRSPLLFTGRRTAELIKYAGNAFLATEITFMNEIADLSEKVGADVQDVACCIGLDDRIGAKFFQAAPGYGGSCFPEDTLALIKTGQDHGASQRIVETVVVVNDQRKRSMGSKIIAACGGDVRGKRVALLGLTFNPNTDDMRDAPSLAIVTALQDGGAEVRAYDPEGMSNARTLLGRVTYVSDAYDCAKGADAVAILTESDLFRVLDWDRIKRALRSPVLIDLPYTDRPAEMRARGFNYDSIGQCG